MALISAVGAAGAAGAVTAGSAGVVDNEALKQLAPTGTLRVGVAYAPSATPLFVVKDANGDVRGVPRTIGMALAKSLGANIDIVAKATTGELADALRSGAIDIAFMPVDDERRKILDFSPPYFSIECTYLVVATSGIKTLGEVDRPDVTVVGIAGSTTNRAASQTLQKAHVVSAKSIDDAMALMRSGKAQAFALTHDALPTLQAQLLGSRILDGAFKVNGVAIAIPKGRPAALAYITEFMKNAKANGTVRRALDEAGFDWIEVAP